LLDKKEAAKRRAEIVTILSQAQKKDGSWRSESARMREDDPLIATGFAVIALTQIRNQQMKKTK